MFGEILGFILIIGICTAPIMVVCAYPKIKQFINDYKDII